jgi:hypothetical protein
MVCIGSAGAVGIAVALGACSRGTPDAQVKPVAPASAPSPPSPPSRPSTGEAAPEAAATMSPPTAPTAPRTLSAQATSPFAVTVQWSADEGAATGFAIDVERNGSFVLAAVLGGTARRWTHHHRLPGGTYEYRVRAFHARGVSLPSTAVKVTTPVRSAASGKLTRPPCTRLPKAAPAATLVGRPREVLTAPGGPALYDDPDPSSPLRRHLFGTYEGCVRELGAFDLQADVTAVPGIVDEGFPLLHAIAGAGQYVGASILTLRFAQGHYSVVDEARFCGEPAPDGDAADPTLGTEGAPSDLTTWTPPFRDCQRDVADRR